MQKRCRRRATGAWLVAAVGICAAVAGFGCGGGTGRGAASGGAPASRTGGSGGAAVAGAAGGVSSAGGAAGLAVGSGGRGGGSGGGAAAGHVGTGGNPRPDGGGARDAAVESADAAPPAGAPTGLLVELTAHPDSAGLTAATPDFAWIVHSTLPNAVQTAYRILVASTPQNLDADVGDLWDSGQVASAASVNVTYAGKALKPGGTYDWKVQTWDTGGTASPWSASQAFTMAATLGGYSTPTPPAVQTPRAPASVVQIATGHAFIDFGRDAFGWVELTLDAPSAGTALTVSLGEKANGHAVDLNPGATIRAATVTVTLQKGLHTYRVQTPKDAQNTSSPAIALPAALGVVMPFRYVEVSNSPVAVTADSARQVAVTYPFDTSDGAFSSSNASLDQVWELARYSVVATTFADIYVDGDRERTPYEADSYIHQLGHYAIDRDYALARKSHEYLMTHPTWPTEWKFHSVMMAWADWMYTGNLDSLAQQYAALKQNKTLESYANSDGLLDTGSLMDIVDWPQGERDGYVLTSVNTVVNAFYCHVLSLMAEMADALGKTDDSSRYRSMAATATAALNAKLFNAGTGLYVDGQTTTHSSLHANMFPLAFGLVPAARQAKVVSFVESRGMACSPYGAQYLLEGLYAAGQPDAALALLTLASDRSWQNMLNVGSTITMEAWDVRYKSNLDWNHAWGAAPANIIPRYVLGVRPASPGFATGTIQPQPGSLAHIQGTVSTIRGPVQVSVDTQPMTMTIAIPVNMTANVAVPPTTAPCTPLLDGRAATTTTSGGQTWVAGVGSGSHTIRCQ